MKKKIETNLLASPIANREVIRRTFGKAVRHAVMEHKCAGNPVAAWENGKVVWIQPEDIVLPPDIESDDTETEETE